MMKRMVQYFVVAQNALCERLVFSIFEPVKLLLHIIKFCDDYNVCALGCYQSFPSLYGKFILAFFLVQTVFKIIIKSWFSTFSRILLNFYAG